MTVTSDYLVHELLDKRGIPAAKVRTPHEVVHDPLLHESGAVMRLRHTRHGDLNAVGMGMPIRFSGSTAQFDQPAQELGAANEEVYRGLLKMSEEELSQLRAAGTV